MPSHWEGFGLVALEAMRNRKAVIASRVGGLPELVLDGINGRLMDIRDVPASRDLLAGLNKPELARMGEGRREIFDRGFTSGRVLRQMAHPGGARGEALAEAEFLPTRRP